MSQHILEKLERIVETVRRRLEGDAAVAFVHESGHRVTPLGMVRFLRSMGGRAAIQERIDQGKGNVEILQELFPSSRAGRLRVPPPVQQDLFSTVDLSSEPLYAPGHADDEFDTTRMTIRLPNDVYHALTLAARVEGVSRNQLLVDLLTAALSRMSPPEIGPEEDGT